MNKFCTKCGKELDGSQLYCDSCGAETTEKARVESNQKIVNPESKSKLVAGLLAIFVGTLGIHNFYLGYTSKGICQLLITLLSCGLFAVGVMIWSLIEGINILTGKISVDAKGIPLTD